MHARRMTNEDFKQGVWSQQANLAFGDFKSTKWHEVPFDLMGPV
jgi:hypothetical protein